MSAFAYAVNDVMQCNDAATSSRLQLSILPSKKCEDKLHTVLPHHSGYIYKQSD